MSDIYICVCMCVHRERSDFVLYGCVYVCMRERMVFFCTFVIGLCSANVYNIPCIVMHKNVINTLSTF